VPVAPDHPVEGAAQRRPQPLGLGVPPAVGEAAPQRLDVDPGEVDPRSGARSWPAGRRRRPRGGARGRSC
jgi:hypothetical protein